MKLDHRYSATGTDVVFTELAVEGIAADTELLGTACDVPALFF